MRYGRIALGAILVAALGASFAPAARTQEAADAGAQAEPAAPGFSEEQLEQIVAPIALYPDALAMQILMASTYPLEIVEAARWVKKNPNLKGKELEDALKDQDWDPAVKALCGFPSVVANMNDNLDWTRDLGDAVLDQKTQLLDAIQRMRQKAYAAGNLKTTEQQVVTQQPDKIIVIESKSPEVVYVPTYSPVVVYGPTWSYPSYYYPAMYVPPPPGYGLMAFGAGMAWGAYLSGGCDWGHGHGDIKINNEYNFNRNTNINSNINKNGSWNHNAEHRKGVNYRDNATAKKYGGQGGASRVTRDQARGYDRGAGASTRPAGGAGSQRPGGAASTRERAAAGQRDLGSQRPSAGAGAGTRDVSNRAASGRSQSRMGRDGNSAYSGSHNPSFDRAASGRGASSRSGGMGGGGSRGMGGGGGRSMGGGRGGGGGRR
jgi:hypothetical protein